MTKNFYFLLKLSLTLLVLPGCSGAPVSRSNQMVAQPMLNRPDNPRWINNISVKSVEGADVMRDETVSYVSDEAISKALKASLRRFAWLSTATSSSTYRIKVQVLLIDRPNPPGPSPMVTTKFHYILEDAKGLVVFDKWIVASHEAEFSSHLIGLERSRIATEKSIQKNIESFIQQLNSHP